jgi:hypothetical protein
VVLGSEIRCDVVERDDRLKSREAEVCVRRRVEIRRSKDMSREAEVCVRRRVEIRRSKNMFGYQWCFSEVSRGVADFGEAT